MANILITGVSGYIGGSFLHDLTQVKQTVPKLGTIYALVRKDDQASKVKDLYEAEPMQLDLSDQSAITTAFIEKGISIVYYLIDPRAADAQLKLIDALAAVRRRHGVQTHLIHNSGARYFSAFTGFPTDRFVSDADSEVFSLQKTSEPEVQKMQVGPKTNIKIIEAGEAAGVNTYIFLPCMVYGEGTGFGNKISRQTRAIVQSGKALGQVYKPDNVNGTWPVGHIDDNSSLYIQILRKLLDGDAIPKGRNGFYIATPGSVKWLDVYIAIAASLAKKGVTRTAEVGVFNETILGKMAEALGVETEDVPLMMSGNCTFTPENGKKIGWYPKHTPSHIIETMDDEVDLMLRHI